jgi:hypothetical protein
MLAFRITATIIVAAWAVVWAFAFLLIAIRDIKMKKPKGEYVNDFIVCFSVLTTLGYVIFVLWIL